jgi:phenylalanyl-tRNA synthetase beta chain
MRASHSWLMQLSGLSLTPESVAQKLTSAGLEVEGVEPWGQGLDGVVVAEVRGTRPHPERDKLTLVTVFDGAGEDEVVCGASNVPAPGGRVALAKLGTKLPGGMEIAERKLAGVVSRGMLCSETELGIGSAEGGILVLGDDTPARPGTPITEALGLADSVYEISITPNRPDCLGHLGLARELCVLEGKAFGLPPVPAARAASVAPGVFAQREGVRALSGLTSAAAEAPIDFGAVRVDIADAVRCPRYGAALVDGVRIGPAPFWVRYRLHVLGLRAINNVVDATNLILLGFGHPIHAFDFDKLRGARIQVRLAGPGEQVSTLDGVERELGTDDLLICDGQGPVALAGVMGGANSEIVPETTRVLIECAYFDPRSVRRTSKRLGLHTDSSHRFERGVDPNGVPDVLAHSAALVAALSGGRAGQQALDLVAQPIAPLQIALRAARIESLLGCPFDAALAERLLGGLGCTLTARPDGWQVGVPSHRPDLTREVDLIEELARLRGYDTLPSALPPIRPSSEGSHAELSFLRSLREAGAAAGLHEAVNYAMVADTDLRAARVSEAAPRIANPLSEERSVLRTSLLPGLGRNLRLAQRQQVKRFAVFELSRVFAPPEVRALPHERFELGVLLWGQRLRWYAEDEPLDFYDAKAALQAVVRSVTGRTLEARLDDTLEQDAPYLHPRRRARLVLGDRPLGQLGELHPDVVQGLELEGRPVYGVLDVAALQLAARDLGPVQARPLPRFPSSTRDLALVLEEGVQTGEVVAALRQAGGELVEAVTVFDLYRGEPVPAGHKSAAFHVVYRDPAATLTDKAVDQLHQKLTAAAERRFGATVRK